MLKRKPVLGKIVLFTFCQFLHWRPFFFFPAQRHVFLPIDLLELLLTQTVSSACSVTKKHTLYLYLNVFDIS